jgi:hypothetical protein
LGSTEVTPKLAHYPQLDFASTLVTGQSLSNSAVSWLQRLGPRTQAQGLEGRRRHSPPRMRDADSTDAAAVRLNPRPA